jgi:hypothetical protein
MALGPHLFEVAFVFIVGIRKITSRVNGTRQASINEGRRQDFAIPRPSVSSFKNQDT